MIRPGVWTPASRMQFPPKAAYLDGPVGEFGRALHAMRGRAWEENGQTWQGMFRFCEEAGESKNRADVKHRDRMIARLLEAL
eukprot:7492658-Alexandrium_andersonii.AAC.1